MRECSFAKPEVDFLDHKIIDGTLLMDKAKVKAIAEWEPPTKATELRSFLGLENCYRRFIKGYSTIVAPLINLVKRPPSRNGQRGANNPFMPSRRLL